MVLPCVGLPWYRPCWSKEKNVRCLPETHTGCPLISITAHNKPNDPRNLADVTIALFVQVPVYGVWYMRVRLGRHIT